MTGELLAARALEHLGALVACDTRNPPRAIAVDGPLVACLRARLDRRFSVEVIDHGEGCVSVLAVRGAPSLLFNVHLDTVPSVDTWTRAPLSLTVEGDRAYGLGAADTKGAAAALLAATEHTTGDVALLFTTDEEAGAGRCVRAFLDGSPRHPRPRLAIVAEPTRLEAVVAHRGIGSAHGVWSGVAGHASSPRALSGSAVHAAVRWGARALAFAEEEEGKIVGGLAGVRFNLGVVQGGHKSNVIADRAEVRFGVRPRPGEQPAALLARLTALAGAPATVATSATRPTSTTAPTSATSFTTRSPTTVAWRTTFEGPSLDAAPSTLDDARRLGLRVSAPVDYWTEAALFAAAGVPAIVYGPGDIAQAHAADEHVPVADLAAAALTYARLVGGSAP